MCRNLLLILHLLTGLVATAQSIKVYGKITNAKGEPLAFASVQVKEYKQGNVTKEDGSYQLELEEGKYDLVVSMVGYKVQMLTVIIRKTDYQQDIIM